MPISQAGAGSVPQEITGKAGNKGGKGSKHDAFTGLLEAVAAASAVPATLAPDARASGHRSAPGIRPPKVEPASPSLAASVPQAQSLAPNPVPARHQAMDGGTPVAATLEGLVSATGPKASAARPAASPEATAAQPHNPIPPAPITHRPTASAATALSAGGVSKEAVTGAQAAPVSMALQVAQAPGAQSAALEIVKPSGRIGSPATPPPGAHAPHRTGPSPEATAVAPAPLDHQAQPQGTPAWGAIVIPPSALAAMAAPAPPQTIGTAIPAQAREAVGSQVSAAVSAHISNEGAGAGTTLQLRVFPENLGEVVVRITTSGGSLSVHLSGSSAALGQLLHASRTDIAASLQSSGASNVTVELGLFGGGAQQHAGRQQPETPNPVLFNPGWRDASAHRTQAPEGHGGSHRLDLLA